MHLRNRIALYGSYSLGLAGVGFTLPYLPLLLGQRGMSDRTIGLLSTLAALAGLVQFPIGIWSDRLSRRRPFLLAAYAALAVSTILLLRARNLIWLGFLVVVFAENGLCRPAADSLSGATAVILSAPGQVGTALGALRFWRPVGIVAMCVVGGLLAQRYGVASILWPLAAIQVLAVVFAWFLREQDGGHSLPLTTSAHIQTAVTESVGEEGPQSTGQPDRVLWIFVAAMILFHIGNAPGGVYLGLFASRELHASERFLSYLFVISMMAWMLTVWPTGKLADRVGRKPLLAVAWSAMTLRLILVAIARAPWQILIIQVLDGMAQGMFIVVAAAWVTDRFDDPGRNGEAQVLVGSALVAGSAIGPTLAGLVLGALGYRGMFLLLSAIGLISTGIVVALVPESLKHCEYPR